MGRRNYVYLNLSSPRTISPYTYTYTFVRNHKLSKGNRPIVLVKKIFKKPIVIYFLWGRRARWKEIREGSIFAPDATLTLDIFTRVHRKSISVHTNICSRVSSAGMESVLLSSKSALRTRRSRGHLAAVSPEISSGIMASNGVGSTVDNMISIRSLG